MTCHVRHIFMPINQTNAKFIYLTQQFVKSNYFNPIHGATKREQFDCYNNSIPFCIDLVYIMVHFSKFSLIIFVAVSAEKESSLHTIILETKHKQSNTLSETSFEYIFLPRKIRYFKPTVINTHIDYQKKSKLIVRAFSKQPNKEP